MGYCPFLGLCHDRGCWFPIATVDSLSQQELAQGRKFLSRPGIARRESVACTAVPPRATTDDPGWPDGRVMSR